MTPTAERWIREKRALPLPSELSTGFDTFLNGLPWRGSGLDWSRMPPAESINIAQAKRRDLFAWARRTRIGSHSHIAVWYSEEEGGVVTGLEFGLVSLDELYLGAPGTRFAFGVDMHGDRVEPAYGDLLQYGNSVDNLIAVGI